MENMVGDFRIAVVCHVSYIVEHRLGMGSRKDFYGALVE
jgi:hypothetical protein